MLVHNFYFAELFAECCVCLYFGLVSLVTAKEVMHFAGDILFQSGVAQVFIVEVETSLLYGKMTRRIRKAQICPMVLIWKTSVSFLSFLL